MTRVLVVEDDIHVREMLVHRLETQEFTVETESDGADCWAQLDSGELDPPDAFVLDVMLPGLDGFALLERLSDDGRFSEVPVVMVTARGSETDVIRAFDLGADDYVTKPFSPTEVARRLSRLT